jgi:predicted RNA-binding protein with RPS1 domain
MFYRLEALLHARAFAVALLAKVEPVGSRAKHALSIRKNNECTSQKKRKKKKMNAAGISVEQKDWYRSW